MGKTHQACWVTLCMRGDGYGPGVIALAHALQMVGSQYPLVCMTTPDVSPELIKDIQESGSINFAVEYIQRPVNPLITARQMELYGSWITQSFTKARCLQLYQLGYQRCIFLDADILPLENIDHLMDLQFPAATLSSPWSIEWDPSQFKRYSTAMYPTDHGEVAPPGLVAANLNGGFTIFGSMIGLPLSAENWERYLGVIHQSQEPYGHRCWSTHDEQSLVECFKECGWTHIHQRYNYVSHKIDWITKPDGTVWTPSVLHYFSSTKPWLLAKPYQTDYNVDKIWWCVIWHLCYIKNPKHKWKSTVMLKTVAKIAQDQTGVLPTFKLTTMDDEWFSWLGKVLEKNEMLNLIYNGRSKLFSRSIQSNPSA